MLRGQEWCIMIPVQVVYGVSIANTLAICNGKRRKEVVMIDLTGMISIPYLKKTVFTGSEKGNEFYDPEDQRRGRRAG